MGSRFNPGLHLALTTHPKTKTTKTTNVREQCKKCVHICASLLVCIRMASKPYPDTKQPKRQGFRETAGTVLFCCFLVLVFRISWTIGTASESPCKAKTKEQKHKVQQEKAPKQFRHSLWIFGILFCWSRPSSLVLRACALAGNPSRILQRLVYASLLYRF